MDRLRMYNSKQDHSISERKNLHVLIPMLIIAYIYENICKYVYSRKFRKNKKS